MAKLYKPKLPKIEAQYVCFEQIHTIRKLLDKCGATYNITYIEAKLVKPILSIMFFQSALRHYATEGEYIVLQEGKLSVMRHEEFHKQFEAI